MGLLTRAFVVETKKLSWSLVSLEGKRKTAWGMRRLERIFQFVSVCPPSLQGSALLPGWVR